jgi:putative inorganic carbon (HCO3(-)) transporter
MRDLALTAVLLALLALAAARPFVGVLVWSWISFMNPHREVWGFAQTMPWAMMTFLVTVFGCFVAREPKRFAMNAVTLLLIVFAAFITVTSLAGIGPEDSRWRMYDKTIKIIAGLLLTGSLLTERRRVDALLWLMVIAIGFYGVKGGIFTLVTGGGFIVLGPPDTMIADRNHLAVALLVVLPLMNYLRLQAAHHIVRLGLVFAMATTLIAAVGSQSRGALVALVATAGMFWLRSRGKLFSGIAIAVAVAGVIAFMPDSWAERMNTMRSFEEDRSAMGRVEIWRAAWALAVARPLLGGGFRAVYDQGIVNTYSPGITARATHSIWFEVMADHGLLGFAIWLALLVAGAWYMRRLIRLSRGRPELRWAYDLARMSQVSSVAYCVGGTFLSLSYWDFFWTLLIVIAATHSLALATVARRGATQPAATHLWRAPAPGVALGRP